MHIYGNEQIKKTSLSIRNMNFNQHNDKIKRQLRFSLFIYIDM